MILALKFLLAPALVVASTLAGRRWGPAVAGVLVALPVVVGPILLITGLDHGPRFAADAASASLLGQVSLAGFALVVARCSRALGWVPTLLLGWTACLLLDLAVVNLSAPPLLGLGLVLAAAALATAAMPPVTAPATGPGIPRPEIPGPEISGPGISRPAWDLPARALATAVLVLVVTSVSAGLGPELTGVLTPFPIATSVVAAFTLAQGGHGPAVLLLRGLLRGLAGLATFSFVIAVLLVPAGLPAGFTVAAAASVVTQLVVSRLPLRANRAAAPGRPADGALIDE